MRTTPREPVVAVGDTGHRPAIRTEDTLSLGERHGPRVLCPDRRSPSRNTPTGACTTLTSGQIVRMARILAEYGSVDPVADPDRRRRADGRRLGAAVHPGF